MMSWLAWLEQTGASVWVRESPSLWAFPFILFLHTLGLALLAGISVAIDLWLLGTARRLPAGAAAGLYRVMWAGFGINALSGVALLAAYPAKALTNPVFYAKLLLVALALVVLEALKKEAFGEPHPVATAAAGTAAVGPRARLLAGASLAIWAGTILAGRLLAYTHTVLLASDPY
jgi:hypothetical protein